MEWSMLATVVGPISRQTTAHVPPRAGCLQQAGPLRLGSRYGVPEQHRALSEPSRSLRQGRR
eukprot:7117660-Alexandrium_andersonii.AAC.1